MSIYMSAALYTGIVYVLVLSIVNMIFCFKEDKSIAGKVVKALLLNSRNIYGDVVLLIVYIIAFPLAIPTIILGVIFGILKIGFFPPSEAFKLLKVAIGFEEYLDIKKIFIRADRKKDKCRYSEQLEILGLEDSKIHVIYPNDMTEVQRLLYKKEYEEHKLRN